MVKNREQIIFLIKDFITTCPAKYSIAEVFLFGSYAENRANNNSDIDIVLILNNSIVIKERQDLYFWGKEHNVDFDVVAISQKDFQTEDPVIVHEIKTKGVKIA